MFIYESHLGGLYATDYELSYEERHCETCGDTDWLVGEAETQDEAWTQLKSETNIDNNGGYDYDYVQKFIKENWES